jgi:hypothetical protein
MNRTEMIILATILTFLMLMSLWIGYAHAGTSLQGLSKTVEIVDMDKWVKAKLAAEEYARKQMRTEIIDGYTFIIPQSTTSMQGAMVFCSSQEVQQP